MSFVSFSDRFDAFDVTPVENLFIDEYMLRAPGDFVKVYLLCLRMCYRPDASHSAQSMARALEMDPDAVRAAMAYWEREGVMQRVADVPPQYALVNLKEMLLTREAVSEDFGGYRDFNRKLQDIFGERILHEQDFTAVYDWVEALGLSREAALTLARHCLETKGRSCRMASMSKVAVDWAERGITTAEAAERFLREQTEAHKGARKVLSGLGLRRNPTTAEEMLYAKWIGEWGFALDAILAAVEKTAGSREPTFKYLNAILENLASQGIKSAVDVRSESNAPQKTPPKPSGEAPRTRQPAAGAQGRPSKEVAEHRYTQRTYTNEDLLKLFKDYSDAPEIGKEPKA